MGSALANLALALSDHSGKQSTEKQPLYDYSVD
jgi:hypothetical protein